MVKFIKLTERGPLGRTFLLNLETIEYVLPLADNRGSEVVTVRNHTKYIVRESVDDILNLLETVNGVLRIDAKETETLTETERIEDHHI